MLAVNVCSDRFSHLASSRILICHIVPSPDTSMGSPSANSGSSVYDNPEYSIEIIQALEAKAQLDKPMISQYFHFLKGALRGDWGVSVKIAPGIPVFSWSSLEKTSTHIRSGSRTLTGPICLPGSHRSPTGPHKCGRVCSGKPDLSGCDQGPPGQGPRNRS